MLDALTALRERLFNRVKFGYEERMNRLSKSGYRVNNKHDDVWRGIVEFCLENGVSPDAYLDYAFKTEQPYPWPNAFGGSKMRRLFLDGMKGNREQLDILFKTQMMMYQKLLRLGLKPPEALRREGFDAAFVYVMSEQQGFRDLASASRQAALEQFILQPEYVTAYADIMSPEVKQQIIDLRKKVLNGYTEPV